MTKEEIISGTLEWCNERRKEKNLEPLEDLPKGKRWDGNSCPCGTACGYYVGYKEYYKSLGIESDANDYMEGGGIGEVPQCVHDFALMFDEGRFPQYDINQ